MPHEYCLRKNCNDNDFITVVLYIRKHGYIKIFKGREYKYLDYGNHTYWTMGSAIEKTILINRAKI